METINDRVEAVKNHYGLKGNDFARKAGVKIMTMNYILARKSHKINSDVLKSIIENLPDIDIVWLITGKGEMLKKNTEIKNVIIDKVLNEIMNDKINQKFNLLHDLIEKEKKLMRNTLSRHGIVIDE